MERISHSGFDSSAIFILRITFRFTLVCLEGSGLDSSRSESSWLRTNPPVGCGVNAISMLRTMTLLISFGGIACRRRVLRSGESLEELVGSRGEERQGSMASRATLTRERKAALTLP